MSDSESKQPGRWRPFTIWTKRPAGKKRLKEAIPVDSAKVVQADQEPSQVVNPFTIWTRPGGIRSVSCTYLQVPADQETESVSPDAPGLAMPTGRPFTVWALPGGIQSISTSVYTNAAANVGGDDEAPVSNERTDKKEPDAGEPAKKKTGVSGGGCLPWVFGLLAFALLGACLFLWVTGKNDLEEANIERDDFQKKLTIQTQNINALVKESRESAKVAEAQKEKLTDLTNKLEATVKEHRAEVDQLNESITGRDRQTMKIEEALAKGKKELEESSKEKTSLKGDVDYLKKGLAEAKAKSEKQLAAVQSKVADSEKEMKDLAEKLKASEADWKKKFTNLEKQNVDLSGKLKASDDVGKDLVQKLDSAAKEKAASEDDWKKRLEALRDELNKLKENAATDEEI